MRIARFAAAGKDPAYGIIELEVDGGENPETIAAITGDPLAGVPVNYTGARHDLSDVRLLAPVIPRSKIVAVGRNYADHAIEQGAVVPAEPMLFLKPNTCGIGPNEPIVRPDGCEDLHYEGELAIIIGRICKQVPEERVADVVFGYTIANDVTARDWQREGDQWFRAKGSDTFCPLGPWINTHFTLAEAGHLAIETRLGDEVLQRGNTAQMVRGISDLVTYISSFTTLLPGDVILTGTPAGVGPMADGDVVSVEIDGLGVLSNPVTSA